MRKHTAPAERKGPGRGRVAGIAAACLALLGAILLIVAACSARPGPPQPSASSAGTIDGEASYVAQSVSAPATTSSSPGAPAPAAATSSAPSTTSPAAPGSTGSSTRSTSSSSPTKSSASSTKTPSSAPKPTAGPQPLLLKASHPTSLSIPAIGVKSSLLDFGLNKDGTVQVQPLSEPDSKAGWYDKSPSPGTLGPSIILGHIDSKQYGPGVFYNLGKLKPGDQVNVARSDGSTAVFKVDGVRSYPKNDFPTLDVYGNIDHAGLRLITCGGTFDPNVGSYENNIVVYASLVSAQH